jgi:hypothetical protein
LTTEERVQAVADHGFTDRQARFLVLVMRHSGLCIKRQYGAFAGVKPGGEKCNAFFEKLVRRGLAVTSECIHNRARLYHVHDKPLYHAIGEPESRYRRAVPARQAANRLMRLDAALISPHLDWLTTNAEKQAYLAAKNVADTSDPSVEALVPNGSDLFPGTFPIGVDASGRVVLLYVVTVPWTDDFRLFLVGHVPLLSVTPAWTLRVVFPQALQRAVDDYRSAVREELESPLQPATLNDLKWYFFHRRRGDFAAIADILRARYTRCARVFAGPRFARLYQQWRADETAELPQVPASVVEALSAGRAEFHCDVLPYTYEQFSPLVSPRRARRRHTAAEDKKGEETSRSLNPTLN